jgi:pyoverdine/dityrosine biosynthesis protein Dit1
MAQSSEVSALLHPHEVISQFFNPIAHDDSVSSLPNSAPARLETPIESVPDIHNLLPHFPNLLDGSNPASPINGPQKLSARSLTPLPNDSLDLQNAEPLESKPEPVPSSVQLVTGSLQLSETESTRIADMIVEILERYRMTPRDGSSPWVARHQFVEKIVQCIEHQSEIRLALPAFPFKSPNKTAKVLGDLPDCGEETALLHLNGMCQAIGDLHKAGASLHIVSDGLMYNVSNTYVPLGVYDWVADPFQDILGVSDLEVWNYGQCLRKLAERLDCRCIRFIRLVELLGRDVLVEPLSEEEYLRDAPTFREKIYETFLPQDFDVDAFIGGEKDATLTYRGYLKFLELDLENALVMTGDMSKSQKKKGQEEIAKKMIRRGKVCPQIASFRDPTE